MEERGSAKQVFGTARFVHGICKLLLWVYRVLFMRVIYTKSALNVLTYRSALERSLVMVRMCVRFLEQTMNAIETIACTYSLL